jgi:hypothetical protein
MSNKAETRVPVSIDTRDTLKKLLRGGEPYDTLFRRMIMSLTNEENDSVEIIDLDEMSELAKMWCKNNY